MNKKMIGLLLVVAIFFTFLFFQLQPKHYESKMTLVKIINKDRIEEKNQYWINGEDVENGEKLKILTDSNIWNLIELDKTYTLFFEWKGTDTPQLTQINPK